MNNAVTKATKPDGNYPKEKHVITLNTLSWESRSSAKNILDILSEKIYEGTAECVLKSLIVINCLMRDGCPENIFGYLAQNPRILDSSTIKPRSLGYIKLKTIKTYTSYLQDKVYIYQKKRVDFAESRSGPSLRLMTEGVEAGLLDSISILQDHLEVILQTEFHGSEIEDHVNLYLFKFLIRDLLKIFQCVNQGVISILQSYFDLNKDKAEKCLVVYKRFIKQTEKVLNYLSVARDKEFSLQFTVPDLKHAPISLLESLEEYLKSISGPQPSSQKSPTPATVTSNKEKQLSAKQDALDFFASLDDKLTVQDYQPVVPSVNSTPNHHNIPSHPFASFDPLAPSQPQSTGSRPGQPNLFSQTPNNLFTSGANNQNSLFTSGPQAQSSLFASAPQPQNGLFSPGPQAQNNLFTSGPQAQNSPFTSAPQAHNNSFTSGSQTQFNLFTSGPQTQPNLFATTPQTQNNLFPTNSQTPNNLFASGPQTTSNPFATFSGSSQLSPPPKQPFSTFNQSSQPPRASMNPFVTDGTSFGTSPSLPPSQFHPPSSHHSSSSPASHPSSFSIGQPTANSTQPSTNFANFFNQHSFPTQ